MIKIAALLFNSIALFFYQLFFIDEVTLTPKVPETVKPGTEFVMELTIDKGSNSGFAKFQQELPSGFTAVEIETSGGSFTFNDQTVKIIWMALPEESSFKISYKINVSPETSGIQTLSGKFSFVVDNVKQTVEVPETTINVTSDETNAIATNSDETQQPPSTTGPPKAPSLASTFECTRKMPGTILNTNEFFVEVIVKKGNIGGFGKFTETLPEGMTATATETQGAVFSFDDQKAVFIWGTMPMEQEFKVIYKVNMSGSTSGEQLIEGVFAFVENDKTLKYVLKPGFIKVIGEKPINTPVVAAVKDNETNKEPESESKTPAISSTTTKTSTQPKSSLVKNTNPPAELSATSIPSGTQGNKNNLNFKVQILALQNAKSVEKIISYFKIKEVVSLEMMDGFTKYTAGYYNEYKEARDARETYRTKNKIEGPFVTAYNFGKRITVQEALMISNQQWYK